MSKIEAVIHFVLMLLTVYGFAAFANRPAQITISENYNQPEPVAVLYCKADQW